MESVHLKLSHIDCRWYPIVASIFYVWLWLMLWMCVEHTCISWCVCVSERFGFFLEMVKLMVERDEV